MTTTTVSLDNNQIQLQTLTGKLILGRVKTILWNEEQSSCIILFVVEPDLWSRIWAERLFQLSPETVEHNPADFDQPEVIELELALNRSILSQLATIAKPIEALLQGLGGTKPELSVLAHCTSWTALSAVQEVPVPNDPESKLQMGFKTMWGQNVSNLAVDRSENTSDDLLELVKRVFEEQDWEYELSDTNYFSTAIVYKNNRWGMVVNVDLEQDFCLVYSVFPEDISPERRALVAQQIAYFNYDLYLGNWEIDLDDGELRFRTSIDTAKTQIDVRLIKQLIMANVQIMGQSIQKMYDLL